MPHWSLNDSNQIIYVFVYVYVYIYIYIGVIWHLCIIEVNNKVLSLSFDTPLTSQYNRIYTKLAMQEEARKNAEAAERSRREAEDRAIREEALRREERRLKQREERLRQEIARARLEEVSLMDG